jgi:hypothetical protein
MSGKRGNTAKLESECYRCKRTHESRRSCLATCPKGRSISGDATASQVKSDFKTALTSLVYVLVAVVIAFLVVEGKRAVDTMAMQAAGEVGAAVKTEIQRGIGHLSDHLSQIQETERNLGSLVVGTKPAEAAFVGRWQLESKSLPSVTNRTGNRVVRAELLLTADGRFTATDFPIEDGFSNPKWYLKSGAGFWKLSQSLHWVVDLGFADGLSTPLDIRTKNGAVVALTYAVGDPDSNELWIWRRESAAQKGSTGRTRE